MKILKILVNKGIEIVDIENIFDYASSIFGSTHIDSRAIIGNYAIIYDDAMGDETPNPIASKLFNNKKDSMKGDCLLIKIDSNYKCHSCYENALSIDNEDWNYIKGKIDNEIKAN